MSARKHAPLAPDGSCLPCLRCHHIFERVMVQITICDSPLVRGHRTPSPYAMTQPARLAGTAQPERSSSAGVAANLLCVLREVRQSKARGRQRSVLHRTPGFASWLPGLPRPATRRTGAPVTPHRTLGKRTQCAPCAPGLPCPPAHHHRRPSDRLSGSERKPNRTER